MFFECSITFWMSNNLSNVYYLIASRSPPGQPLFVIGLGVTRTKYKKQCNHIPKKCRKRNSQVKQVKEKLTEKCKKSVRNPPKIHPKRYQKEAKRKMESKKCLQDGLGGLRRPSPPLSWAGWVPTWSRKSNKVGKKSTWNFDDFLGAFFSRKCSKIDAKSLPKSMPK